MKREVRVIAFDDAPHTRADGRVPVVGVRMRGASYLEGLLATDVARDGDDATNRVARAVADSGIRGIRALMLDGASFAGFNVVDLDGLHAETGIPCLAFTVGTPDMDAMRNAIRNVANWEGKWALLERRRNLTIPTASGATITLSLAGLSAEEAAQLLALTTVRGLVPEPLRVAHLVAGVMR